MPARALAVTLALLAPALAGCVNSQEGLYDRPATSAIHRPALWAASPGPHQVSIAGTFQEAFLSGIEARLGAAPTLQAAQTGPSPPPGAPAPVGFSVVERAVLKDVEVRVGGAKERGDFTWNASRPFTLPAEGAFRISRVEANARGIVAHLGRGAPDVSSMRGGGGHDVAEAYGSGFPPGVVPYPLQASFLLDAGDYILVRPDGTTKRGTGPVEIAGAKTLLATSALAFRPTALDGAILPNASFDFLGFDGTASVGARSERANGAMRVSYAGGGTVSLSPAGGPMRIEAKGPATGLTANGDPRLAATLEVLPRAVSVAGSPGEQITFTIAFAERSRGGEAVITDARISSRNLSYLGQGPFPVTEALLDAMEEIANRSSAAPPLAVALVPFGVAIPFVAFTEAIASAITGPPPLKFTVEAGGVHGAKFRMTVPPTPEVVRVTVHGNFPDRTIEVHAAPKSG